MSLLSPRFFALPLIALIVIVMLPRQPDASGAVAAQQPSVIKAVSCASANAPAACTVAASQSFLVR